MQPLGLGLRNVKSKKNLTDPVRLLVKLLNAYERQLNTEDPVRNLGVPDEAKELYRHAYKHGAKDLLTKMYSALEG